MIDISIINAYGHSNRGDSVLLSECISEIKSEYPTANINVLLFDDYMFESNTKTRKFNRLCNVNDDSLIKQYFKKVYIFIMLLFYCALKMEFILQLLPKDQRKTIEALKKSSIAVSSPGGYIHDTNNAYYIALLHIYLCKCFGLKVILAPQSYGPINGKLGRAICKYVLNNTDIICTRESYSYEFLIKLGVKSDLILQCGDSAFWESSIRDKDSSKHLQSLGIKENEKFIGMTLVDWTFPNQSHKEEKKKNYIDVISHVANKIYDSHNMRTVIFNQVSDDLDLARQLAVLCPESVLVDESEKEPEVLRGLISRSYVFLGTRFHSCIFALMSSVPTLAIAYLPKTEYILKDLEFSNRFFDINNLKIDEILNKVLENIDNREMYSQDIYRSVCKYRTTKNRLTHALRLLK